jgi:membrane fusion protein, heavy metal efflux system
MKRSWITIAAAALAGVLATLAVQSAWFSGADAPDSHEEVEEPRGPHGGRLLAGEGLELEVTIFEEGVEPHYRIYPRRSDGTAIAPTELQLTATLERLGGQIDTLTFVPESDYLRSAGVVEEPHSFSVKFTVVSAGRSLTLSYEQEEGRATIADAALASSGIEIATAAAGTLSTRIELPGEIVVPPGRQVPVAPRAPGVVLELRVAVGQRVSRGDIVAVVSSRDLAQASSAYVAALTREAFTKTTRDREQDLAERRITARQDFQVAEQAYLLARTERAAAREALSAFGLSGAQIDALPTTDPATYARLHVTAPLTGLVTDQTAGVGQSVTADTPVLTVTDTSEVWVHIQVHAKDLDAVRPGRRVTITGEGASRTAEGVVAAVNPLVGDETRTATARVLLRNTDGRWHPGLFVRAVVALENVQAAVVVPADALQTFRDWTVVFVRYGEVFEARPVQVGRTDGRVVEIVAGLRPGERFAAVNAFVVKADVLKGGASHDH